MVQLQASRRFLSEARGALVLAVLSGAVAVALLVLTRSGQPNSFPIPDLPGSILGRVFATRTPTPRSAPVSPPTATQSPATAPAVVPTAAFPLTAEPTSTPSMPIAVEALIQGTETPAAEVQIGRLRFSTTISGFTLIAPAEVFSKSNQADVRRLCVSALRSGRGMDGAVVPRQGTEIRRHHVLDKFPTGNRDRPVDKGARRLGAGRVRSSDLRWYCLESHGQLLVDWRAANVHAGSDGDGHSSRHRHTDAHGDPHGNTVGDHIAASVANGDPDTPAGKSKRRLHKRAAQRQPHATLHRASGAPGLWICESDRWCAVRILQGTR